MSAFAPPASRNAPCPCGSGKRFKDCHGALAPGADDSSVGEARPLADTALPPTDGAALRERARSEWQRGNPEALATCRAALESAPDDAAAWNLLGEILNADDPAAAGEAWWRALELDPENAEASFHLGNRLREQGERAAAVIHYERALANAPRHTGVLNNLGLTLQEMGELARAESCYREVLGIDPRHTGALANLASLLSGREAVKESAATYDRLFAITRDWPATVWIRRAMAQNAAQDLSGAIESYAEAARLSPDDMQVHLHLGTLYLQQRSYPEGESALRRALELDPANRYALSMLAHARQHRCAWSGLRELFARIESVLEGEDAETPFPCMPFATLAMPLSPLAQLRAAQRWSRTIARAPLPPKPVVQRAAGERLRVAFATWNMRDHPTMYLSLEFWEKIDRSRLEMFAYSLRADDDNPFQRRARAAFEHYTDVSQDAVPSIAQRIRDDRIAILVDRNGYTLNAREGIFPLRPAPIQVNCIGFPGTMGAEWYDYIFTDRFGVPEHLQRFYTEQPLYMPHAAFPSDTTRLPPGPTPSRAASGLPEKGFVFCCFNTPYKILPDVFAMWMRLLATVPGSVLWLLRTSAEVRENLRAEAKAAHVDPDRLVFAPFVPVGIHVARNAAADLFLDTFPYGAHTTANDALLAGLPVVTCAGETLVSRIAGSQLAAIGLPELITTSFADYEALALELARRPPLLASYRTRLAENRLRTPLFDMTRYARDFEDAMERIWADHVASR
ncbi:MAG TPA: tetratricopeptide repeat protein [Casimicrobiaceae bacterium]|nr:tetratricopeptide repeat protein [Casimicrobiaceae bacterium]